MKTANTEKTFSFMEWEAKTKRRRDCSRTIEDTSSLVLILLSLFGMSLFLRALLLGNTFQSSDNAELAFKILTNDGSGYGWIIREYYGALINVLVKLVVALLSSLDIVITEFWWKFPIAFVGSLQGPLTYLFLRRRLGCSGLGAVFGAAIVSILPIHVFESRYLWGYEVLGVFFITLAIWKLIDFFEAPAPSTGLAASLASGLYLISHGYILPFVPSLLALIALYAPGDKSNAFGRVVTGVRLCARHFVWVFPLLFFPLCVYPIGHSLRKPTRLGVYLADHLPAFIENTGYFLAAALFSAVVVGLFSGRMKRKPVLLFLVCGFVYLAPLFLGTPLGITVIRGYMLMGTFFLVLGLAIVFDLAIRSGTLSRFIVGTVAGVFVLTLWGTIESVFGRDKWVDPSGVKVARGAVSPDPGSKAAGFLVRKYVKESEKVLAIAGRIEPPVLFYYFDRLQYSFFDLPLEKTIEKYFELKDEMDVIVSSPSQAHVVASDQTFERRTVIASEGEPRLLIYTRRHVAIPPGWFDVSELNSAFDKEYAWRVSFR